MTRIDDWRKIPLTPEEEADIDRHARAYIVGVPPGPDIPPADIEKAVQAVIKATRQHVRIGKRWEQLGGRHVV